jgi:hypothetical protein
MIRLGVWLVALGVPIILWHECGEDIGVFCYRIGLGAFSAVRSRALVPVPVRNSIQRFRMRNNSEWSTPSFTFSARSSTPKDSAN